MKARVIWEATGFAMLLINGLAMMAFPGFPPGWGIWWALFGGFTAVFAMEICLIGPANHAADLIAELNHARSELDRIRDYQVARRLRARNSCLEHCVEINAKSADVAGIIGSLWRANGQKLATNEDLVWVCQQLEERGYGNPFANSSIPPENWLEFLHDAKLAGRDLARDAAAASDAFREWRATRRLTPA